MRALALAAILLSHPAFPASAADRQRVDLYDRQGRRDGYAIVEGSRVDLYDRGSRRIGQGRVSEQGNVELFDRSGKRARPCPRRAGAATEAIKRRARHPGEKIAEARLAFRAARRAPPESPATTRP